MPDLRLQQFANQLILLAIAKGVLHLSVPWVTIGLVLALGWVLDAAGQRLVRKRTLTPSVGMSGVSSAFNTVFMLGAAHTWIYALGLGVGLGQKFLFSRAGRRHFQNPSNLGIALVLLLFPDLTYVTLFDWGMSLWFVGVVVLLAVPLLLRLGLLHIPLAFLCVYVATRLALDTRNLAEIVYDLRAGGVLLFIFLMITDPSVLPDSRRFQVLYGAVCALALVVLEIVLLDKEPLMFLALVIAGCVVPLLRLAERQPPGKRRRLAMAGEVSLVVVVLLLSLTPFNRTAGLDQLLPESDPEMELRGGACGGVSATAAWRWQRPASDSTLYPQTWQHSKVQVIPLAPPAPRGAQRFAPVDAGFAPEARIPQVLFGYETYPYAGVNVGDLDLDGDLDLVLSRIAEPLRVYLNDGAGRFEDVTAHMFGASPPCSIEYSALADLNNDRLLDLIVVPSSYAGPGTGTIYLLDPDTGRFRSTPVAFGGNKRSSGGIAVADVDRNGFLDLYVAYGIDFYKQVQNVREHPYPDVLLLGSGADWRPAPAAFFPAALSDTAYVGMTALFVDINADRQLDFLLGNDFDDPSIVLLGEAAGGYSETGRTYLERAATNSMSFWAADFDNDGGFELWESAIAPPPVATWRTYRARVSDAARRATDRELAEVFNAMQRQRYNCADVTDPEIAALCYDHYSKHVARKTGDRSQCEAIAATGIRNECNALLNAYAFEGVRNPVLHRFDAEQHPRQFRLNVVLRRDDSGRFVNALQHDDPAQWGGWSWAAYPFDLDNDGDLDVYLSNGYMAQYHDDNRLFLNVSQPGAIRFEEAALDWGVALEQNSRGLALADFDGDGDGDLLVNNYHAPPQLFGNQSGGDRIEVELRARRGNYYAIGAQLFLTTSNGVQSRSLDIGGIWNSQKPPRAHFGLAPEVEPVALEVVWPDGSSQRIDDLPINHRLIILQ